MFGMECPEVILQHALRSTGSGKGLKASSRAFMSASSVESGSFYDLDWSMIRDVRCTVPDASTTCKSKGKKP